MAQKTNAWRVQKTNRRTIQQCNIPVATEGELKKETEGMIMPVQDQALRTRYIQRAIDRSNISSKYRKCNGKEETINHIVSECPAIAQNQYKKRHDSLA